jgi:hypothetical protein
MQRKQARRSRVIVLATGRSPSRRPATYCAKKKIFGAFEVFFFLFFVRAA